MEPRGSTDEPETAEILGSGQARGRTPEHVGALAVVPAINGRESPAVDHEPVGPAERPSTVDAAALVGLVVVVGLLWARGRHAWLWLDEGISIGISSHSLSEIPELLRQDGSPPLYYLVLGVWMSVFGSSPASTHVLSLVFAVACLPVALWAGWSLFGRRTGWMLVGLVALSPFLAAYASETRMYTLVVLLSMVATASFVHAFVFRHRRFLPVLAASLTLLLYTHNWALFFAAGACAALVPCYLSCSDRRRFVVDAASAFGAAGLLFAPWLPSLLYQVSNTGAPWSPEPTLLAVRESLAFLVGGPEAVVALGLVAGVALGGILRRPLPRVGVAVVVAAVVITVTVAAGWGVSRASSVWAVRYLAVIVPAIALISAVGLARGGRGAVAALGVIAFFAAPIATRTPPYQKSNLRGVAEQAKAFLVPGDLIVSPDFGEVPLLAYYLPAGLRYATTDGLVADPTLSDQRASVQRMRDNEPEVTIAPLIGALPPGGHVLVVCPPVSMDVGQVELIALIMRRCEEVNEMVLGDPGLKLELAVDATPLDVRNTPVNAYLLTKVGSS